MDEIEGLCYLSAAIVGDDVCFSEMFLTLFNLIA